MGLGVEVAVGAVVAGNRFPQVRRPVGRDRLIHLLTLVVGAGQVAVDQAGGEAPGPHGEGRGGAHHHLPPGVLGGPHHSLGCDLGLVDGSHRAGVVGQGGLHQVELGRVQPREVHHRDPHLAAVVQQLAPQGLGEALDRVLGRAVGRLQGDRPVGEGGADLDDHAPVAGLHPGQGRQDAVDLAQVGHARHPGELGGRRLRHRGQHRGHGRVDPHVDGAQLVLRGLGGAVDGLGVGDVEGEDQGPPAGRLHLLGRRFEALDATGDEGDIGPPLGEGPHAGPPHPGAGPGDDDDPRPFGSFHGGPLPAGGGRDAPDRLGVQ